MSTHARQYTIRNIPQHVDRLLRRRARDNGKSLNQVALEALSECVGESRQVYDDLDFMIGSMTAADAKHLEHAVAQQRRIDPKLC